MDDGARGRSEAAQVMISMTDPLLASLHSIAAKERCTHPIGLHHDPWVSACDGAGPSLAPGTSVQAASTMLPSSNSAHGWSWLLILVR